jgi:pimeloyl-ACP methyl ester carboxylesterase
VNTRTWFFALSATWLATSASAQEHCRLVPLQTGAVHACVVGRGDVTVVLAAGAGQTSRTWDDLVPRLSSSARVVTFDRPGLGRSPPGALARTPTRIAREVHEVINALAADGPLVLVGHSMGGVHVLRYATLYPERVRGVVILDTPPPGFEQSRLALLSESEREQRRRLLERGAAEAPEVVRLEREGAQGSAEWDFVDFPGSVPFAVLVADSQDFGTLGSQSAHRRLWIEGSREWLTLSRDSRLTVAEGSGHMVHHDRSDIVLGQVLAMIEASGPWRPQFLHHGREPR